MLTTKNNDNSSHHQSSAVDSSNGIIMNDALTTAASGGAAASNVLPAATSVVVTDVGDDEGQQRVSSVAADDESSKRTSSVDSSSNNNNDGGGGGGTPAKAKDPQESARVMRDYKILELIETEKDYVDDLRKIVEGYMEEMKQHPPPDDMLGKEKIIFGNIAQIYEWHRDTFCKQLEQMQNPDKLAQLFERHFRRLLMYVTYCQNKPKSDCVISDYVDTYFEELRKRLGHRLTLPDLLIKPVQRPMRYELLLKEMAKYTARAGLDAVPFEKAIDLISQGVCKLVDDSMEVGRLSGFEGNLNAQGKLLLQDTFQVADASTLTSQLHATSSGVAGGGGGSGGGHGSSSNSNSNSRARIDSSKCDDLLKFKERRLFLFEQILIVSEVQYIGAHGGAAKVPSNLIKAFYNYKDHIQVNKLSLIDDQAAHRFVVLMRDPHSGEKCYVVDVGDDNKRDLWVARIKQMLDTQINFLRALQSPIDFQRRTQSFT